MMMVLMLLLAVQFVKGTDQTVQEITFTAFRSQLNSGNIHEVTVIDRRIEGELRAPSANENGEFIEFEVTLPGDLTDGLLESLESNDVIVKAKTSQPGWGTFLIGALPWLLFIAFWIWIFRTMQGGGNKAFQFGRSKAKLISPDTSKVTFADVAGADEAKQELEETIDFLKDPAKFSRLGGRLPKGVLLVGPPGTGKTLLARAVAGEAERPFFQMSGSDFVEMFVGVGASRVRDLFEQGKAQAPCIIFVDEIDAVGRHRGAGLGGGHDEREQTLNALLVEMDGFESNEGVILLAATNRPDVLDPALLRPGRFDRQVIVDFPDVKGREGILRVHAKKLPLSDDVELSLVARGTPGMSGADLENICNEAALLAARRDADTVTMVDFEQAKDKIMLGTERRSLVLNDEERRLTAYHEAGHAVIGLRLPGLDPVHKVSIVPRGRALGITASLPEQDRHSYRKEWMEGQLAMLFGGRVAEEMQFGPESVTTGAGNDIERATSMVRKMVTTFGMSEVIGLVAVGDAESEVFLGREIGHRRTVSEHTARLVDQEVKRKLDEAHEKARELLEKNKDLLETIAQALLDRETLDRTELEILESGGTLPPLPNLDDEPITLAEPARPNPVEQSAPSFGLPGGEGLLPGPAPGYHESDGVSDDD
ncbi:MAG: ATP-dependent metallopeptidase FtsH/Yme1/Tma family protein [Gemmatimonadales bacterium]|nr:ATP-dependent metallopeptidase FtsH/Yme1/Tma family protein [Gemmatimonadales bacterium]MBT3499397.1 ATP-dependent metallopeptidase FtsH/Yme1/Tma family protein [Gemmatimonadales bacterium]MBT3774165.1 ATP-dependent metallopeptidase FtsH/Yme1/Tma family protein [Gemmatimonadales bacterium]MBT3958275.1 ATP-dependent metallopeptidase FtsH/Yme1/Tma family protein [Gemmatimonadales bacterium]MBT4187009.1 ATP-dependent metallopeptidase FtsH/Yme1/Tma family protein [Gemmatimonadales bacterium]